jgi:putative acetyltransferase
MDTQAMMHIRPATTDDAPAISALALRAIHITNAPDYDSNAIAAIACNFTEEKVLEKMEVRDVFVALLGEVIAGTISLGSGKLHSLFVDPAHQSLGIGRQLVAHLEEHARAKGLERLWLSSSIAAKPFYERLGYGVLDTKDGRSFTTFDMGKALTP